MSAACPKLRFHDYQPELASFRSAVLQGLARDNKWIPPKFFYDQRGSLLFEAILKQPEYYLPKVERQLLQTHAAEMAELIGPGSVLIEPGSGNCEKVRLLLDALSPAAYVPMDISGDFLFTSAHELGTDFPRLPIYATCLDFTHAMNLPGNVPDGRRVLFFPGSSLGNFEPVEAQHFLLRAGRLVGAGGGLLIGMDRKKDKRVLEAAYNDRAGITADFNLNLLARINQQLDGDFDLDAFAHYACYNEPLGRIEMHLTSLKLQSVEVAGQSFQFLAGERIHTENSYKYDPAEFVALAQTAGFRNCRFWTDEAGQFGIYYLVFPHD